MLGRPGGAVGKDAGGAAAGGPEEEPPQEASQRATRTTRPAAPPLRSAPAQRMVRLMTVWATRSEIITSPDGLDVRSPRHPLPRRGGRPCPSPLGPRERGPRPGGRDGGGRRSGRGRAGGQAGPGFPRAHPGDHRRRARLPLPRAGARGRGRRPLAGDGRGPGRPSRLPRSPQSLGERSLRSDPRPHPRPERRPAAGRGLQRQRHPARAPGARAPGAVLPHRPRLPGGGGGEARPPDLRDRPASTVRASPPWAPSPRPSPDIADQARGVCSPSQCSPSQAPRSGFDNALSLAYVEGSIASRSGQQGRPGPAAHRSGPARREAEAAQASTTASTQVQKGGKA